MAKWGMIGLGLFFTIVVGILAASLGGMELRGGRPLPLNFRSDFAVIPEASDSSIIWLLRSFQILLLVLIIAVVVIFIVFPELRRRILRFLLTAILLIFLMLFLTQALVRLTVEQEPKEEPSSTDLAAPQVGTEEVVQPPAAPNWAIYLTALLIGGAVAFFGLRFWGRRQAREQGQTMEELVQAASEAAAELRAGAQVADVVIRCWARMVEILSRQANTADAPQMTPREFAEALRWRGFRDEAIAKLTKLFEEVRYGRKESEPRREEAIAALAAIEQAYGKA